MPLRKQEQGKLKGKSLQYKTAIHIMKQNILLTGASKGLGLKVLEELVAQGHTVYVVNRSVSEELAQLQKNHPEHIQILEYDLANSEDVRTAIFKNFIGLKTPLHAFINNAAMAYDDIVTNLSVSSLEKMYRVNVFSPMNITKYAIRQMLYTGVAGSIVHLSSISVHTGYKGLAMYASTKGALEAFSKNTAREWGEKGIRSNALVAGFMETEMSATLSSDQKNRIYNRTSLKKATTKESVASTISFLISDAASSITGQNIFVDSGTI